MKPRKPLPKTLPGAVCVQMVRCGKPTCKCTRGELHGPYYYHFARPHGALVKRYVKAEEVARLRALCNARRQEERRRRVENKINSRQLIRANEQLRENERFLLAFLGLSNG